MSFYLSLDAWSAGLLLSLISTTFFIFTFFVRSTTESTGFNVVKLENIVEKKPIRPFLSLTLWKL